MTENKIRKFHIHKHGEDIRKVALPFLGKSLIVGVLAGVITAAFRWVIHLAESSAFAMYAWAGKEFWHAALVFVGLIVLSLLIWRLVKAVPMANSSGIPQVKGIVNGKLYYSWWKVLLAKFAGSSAITAAGLALGREGPAIQLGGCMGQLVGEKMCSDNTQRRILVASGAGAGLGAVLSAPFAGVMFVIEDMMRSLSPLVMLCALTSAVAAQFITCTVFGLAPIFDFNIISALPISSMWVLVPMGILMGLAGSAFTRILLSTQVIYKKLIRAEWLRMMIPFLLAGILGLVLPPVLCGGDAIIKTLSASQTLPYLLLLLAVKFVFFVICFDSAAPGGNLFPILVLGAMLGAICGNIAVNVLGFDAAFFPNFILLGMTGYFSAITHTPITGIIMLMEVSGSFDQLWALALVSVAAYCTILLTKTPPVYDALLEARLKASQDGAVK